MAYDHDWERDSPMLRSFAHHQLNNTIPGTQSRTEGGGVGGLTYSTHLAKEAQGAVRVLMLCVAGDDDRQTTVGGDKNIMVVVVFAFKLTSIVKDV